MSITLIPAKVVTKCDGCFREDERELENSDSGIFPNAWQRKPSDWSTPGLDADPHACEHRYVLCPVCTDAVIRFIKEMKDVEEQPDG